MLLMSHHRSILGWLPLVFFGLVMTTAFILLGITARNGGPPAQVEPPGSPIYMRDGNIAVVRLPRTVIPWQKIEIYDDGIAIRGLNPPQPARATRIRLTPSEQADFTKFRNQWCQQTLAFRPLARDEPFYDVGVRCGESFDVKQAKVPIDMLPQIFQTLLTQLPEISS
jgi:hypothetical protein